MDLAFSGVPSYCLNTATPAVTIGASGTHGYRTPNGYLFEEVEEILDGGASAVDHSILECYTEAIIASDSQADPTAKCVCGKLIAVFVGGGAETFDFIN